MATSIKWRSLFVSVCILFAIICLAPTFVGDNLPGWWKNNFDPIHLGLDLQGGMHLVLGVDADEAVISRLDSITDEAQNLLNEKDIVFKRIERRAGERVVITVYDAEAGRTLDVLMKESFPNLEPMTLTTDAGYVEKNYRLSDKEVADIREFAIRQVLETLRNRIDQFGVSEPTIQRQSGNRILVQLPGIKDPERAVALLGKTARLDFRMVAEEVNPADAVTGKLPRGTRLLYQKNTDKRTGAVTETPVVVYDKTILTGDLLDDAQVRIDTRFNEPYVSIKFNSVGARRFEQVTSANVNKRMAIVLDDTVYSAPVIRERIAGGEAQISGSFTEQEATDLAIVLRAGSLPAPVHILEDRTVGPSLGQDSINKGTLSVVVGFMLVIVSILIYYRLSGLVANVALMLNLLFILALLSLLGATLTLPGIAGIVLTVGMAVDANVLIFERIREELRLGKTALAAVEAGYEKAFLTIIDANVTTLIAALVLFQFGTGPVKGFAVTLSIGIIASLFTAIFVTRTIFNYFLYGRQVKQLSI